jgi:glycosyltransferase involved in cell wall biosynthesis
VSSLDYKTVAAAGRLCYQKNFDLLIDSWQSVHRLHPDWILEIWGDGPDKLRLQQKILDLRLEESVYLKGYEHCLITRLASSSIFVLSSLYEGFGLVIVEAMSCGVPVVSTACPCGPKDIISEGENGYLVPVGDRSALADRISRLIEDSNLRKQMGASALKTSQQYSMNRIIGQWMSLFEELLAERYEIASR